MCISYWAGRCHTRRESQRIYMYKQAHRQMQLLSLTHANWQAQGFTDLCKPASAVHCHLDYGSINKGAWFVWGSTGPLHSGTESKCAWTYTCMYTCMHMRTHCLSVSLSLCLSLSLSLSLSLFFSFSFFVFPCMLHLDIDSHIAVSSPSLPHWPLIWKRNCQ